MKSDYIPAPIDVSDIQLPSELCELAEIIAKNVHEVWAAGRLAEGWKYGSERNDMLRTHPGWCLMRNCPKRKKITTAGQPWRL